MKEKTGGSYKNFNSEADKPFFGVYLNQARLNAYITLCEITDIVGGSAPEEGHLKVAPVLDKLSTGKDLIKKQRVFDLINERFPMLKVIYEPYESQKQEERQLSERASDYHKILKCLLNVLHEKRNEFCHFHSGKSKLEKSDIKELCWHLDGCFNASVNKIKNQKGFSEDNVLHLRRKTRINGRIGDNPQFFCNFMDSDGELTEKGLAFLTALFLQRRDAFLFLKKIKGFKRDDEAKYKATLESFCAYQIRVPKPVIKSDNDENGLALDMLNELSKCPKELFGVISKEKQDTFLRKNDNENGNEIDNDIENEVLMKRYTDRFGYLVLKYCDDMEVFKKLRFHIDLGKYYFKFYDKDTIDGERTKRSLDRRLRTFGRLKEVKREVDGKWKGIIRPPHDVNKENTDPFKADNTPHYHIVGGNIGLAISPKVELGELNPETKYKLRQPQAWLSVYELPAMIFYGITKSFDKAEQMLTDYIREHSGVSEDTSENNSDNSIDYRKRKLERFIADAENRIKSLENSLQRGDDKNNKPGKRKFKDIKAGELADFLARDMVAMQTFDPEKKGKDKITSLNFQVLQSNLAFYGRYKSSLRGIFEKAGLIGGTNPHPFLAKLRPENYNSIISFYRAYLEEKIVFFKGCEERGDLTHQSLRPKRPSNSGKKSDTKGMPVNIPRGFFSDKIKELVCGEIAELKGREMNCAYMIGQYFERCLHDESQEFYSYERRYPIAEKTQNYRKKNRRNSNLIPLLGTGRNYSDFKKQIARIPDDAKFAPPALKENLFKECGRMKDNERALRRYQVQDMVMMMMVEEILKPQLVGKGDWDLKLRDIGIENGSLFKKPIDCTIYYEEAPVGDETVLTCKIKSTNAKLKDIGKYRRYIYDRRLPGLLLWKKAGEIDVSVIETEISSYENLRVDMAQRLSELEKIALGGRDKTAEYVPFREVISILKERMPEFAQKGDILLAIRNKLYHNQFPAYCEQIDTSEGETIAEKIKNVVDEYVLSCQRSAISN